MHESKIHPDRIETRTALLEQSIGHINQTLIRIEKKLDKVDEKFDKIDKRFEEIRQETKHDFRWIIGMIVGLSAFTVAGFTGLFGVMAHGFKWI